jgi:hypothetical protein
LNITSILEHIRTNILACLSQWDNLQTPTTNVSFFTLSYPTVSPKNRCVIHRNEATTNLHRRDELLEAQKPLPLNIGNRPHLAQGTTSTVHGKFAHYNIEPEMRHPKGQQLGATRAHQTKLHQQYHILASQSSDWLHKFTLFNSVRFPAWHQALLINVDNLEENYLLQFCLGQLRQGEKLDSIVASETSIVICESRMKIYKSSYPDSYNWAILKVLKYEA